jgi:hypothetical protein
MGQLGNSSAAVAEFFVSGFANECARPSLRVRLKSVYDSVGVQP